MKREETGKATTIIPPYLDGEFVIVYDRLTNKETQKVGHLAIVTIDKDNSSKVLFDEITKPQITPTQRILIKIKYSGITWKEYNNNGINYEEAIVNNENIEECKRYKSS